jgi:spore coat protein U-like protein
MNARLQWLAAAALLGGNAVVADTTIAKLTVTATVSLTCSLTTTPVAFGLYDPASAPLKEAAGAVTITCTKGAFSTVALDAGAYQFRTGDATSRRMKQSGLDHYLSYTLAHDPGEQQLSGDRLESTLADVGDGTIHHHPVYGRIAVGQAVPAGSYFDTVLATVTYH